MPTPKKPSPLLPGGALRVISPASSANPDVIAQGVAEIERLGYRALRGRAPMSPDGYFAGPLAQRAAELQSALQDPAADAVISTRGGYGSTGILDQLHLPRAVKPKLLIGFSDITALHIYLWQRFRWTSLHGPMVGAGLDRGAGNPCGYDRESFVAAASGSQRQWSVALDGEALVPGEATGVLLGGCLTLIETTLGTPWELDTRGAILLCEDRGMKPYQVDRLLTHLAQAGKFRGVRGFVFGDFPDSDPPKGSTVTIKEICRRILGPLGVPVVFGSPVGHTERPMLTMPLGVRVRLHARGAGKLDILEPAVMVGSKKAGAKKISTKKNTNKR